MRINRGSPERHYPIHWRHRRADKYETVCGTGQYHAKIDDDYTNVTCKACIQKGNHKSPLGQEFEL